MSDTYEIDVVDEETLQEPSTEIFANDVIKQEMIDYISRELEEASSDSGRETRMERNKKIKRQRLSQPESETKDFPWKNASNVATPLALQKTNIVATKLMSAFMSKKPLFKYETDDPMYVKHAEAITRHIQRQVESPYGTNLYQKLWPIIYNAVSLGTEFVKVPFVVEQMKFNRISPEGGSEPVDKIIKAVPDVVPIEFEDFITRYQWNDPQSSPWIAIKHTLNRPQLKRLVQQGYYLSEAVNEMITEPEGADEHKIDAMALMGVEETGVQDEQNYEYRVYECYLKWDVDGDGFDEEISMHFSEDTILRAEFNDLGMRPVWRIPYIDIPGQLYGLGVGDIMSSLQDEADTLHNMRNDGTQLSMMPFVVTSETSTFGQSMDLYPGKFMKAQVPREDIIVHKFPGVGGEAIQAENMVQSLADDATGASQALGGQDVGGYNRIGAEGTQFLASQSNSYLDTISMQMGFALGHIGLLMLFQNVKNSLYIDDSLDTMGQADAQLCREVYSMNVEDIPTKFKFTARLSSIADSRMSKQNEAMQLFSVYTAYVDKIIQLGASAANPQFAQIPEVSEAIQTGYVGLTKMMKDILSNYDEDSVGDYLPFVEDKEKILNEQDLMRKEQIDSYEAEAISGPEELVEGPRPQDAGRRIGGPDNAQGAGTRGGQGTEQVPDEQETGDFEPV